MNNRRYTLPALILVTATLLSACGANPQGENAVENAAGELRTELTESEMEGGHASYQMDDNLFVDADVTVKSKYENGLPSYYLEILYETEDTSKETFKKNPMVCQRDFKEWSSLLEKIVPGKFEKNKFLINKEDDLDSAGYEAENGRKYFLDASWAGIVDGLDKNIPFNSTVAYFNSEDRPEFVGTEYNIMKHIRNYADSNDLDFLQNVEEQADTIKAFLEEMSGRTINSRYDFVPVGKTNFQTIQEKQSAREEQDREYGWFCFCYDVNGLPFKNMYLNYDLGDKEAEEISYWSSAGGKQLVSLSEHEQEVLVDRDGILSIVCSKMRDVGEQYRERTPVISPNEALKQVKAHYDRELLTEPCYISDIELVYTGYFSDGSEELVRPVVMPFWVVTVYDEIQMRGRQHFTYDAYTGECIEEAAAE